ncbi:hypothetical protein ACFQMM_01075 [Saliphagus sp. GCM10025308]
MSDDADHGDDTLLPKGYSRGQAEVIAVVVLLGFVIIAAIGIVAVGQTALAQLESQSRDEAATQSLDQAKMEFASLQTGETREFTFSESIQRDTRVEPDAGSVTISVEGFDAISNESFQLGSIIYEHEGSHVAYQGGGVWKRTDGRTQLVSSPDIQIETTEKGLSSIRVDVTSVRGTEAQSNNLKATSDGLNETALGLPDRLPAGPMTLEIQSEYYDGWADYFANQDGIEKGEEGEIGSVQVDDATQTMILEVDIDHSIPEVHSARIGSSEAGSQPVAFENGSEINSYNSATAATRRQMDPISPIARVSQPGPVPRKIRTCPSRSAVISTTHSASIPMVRGTKSDSVMMQ